MANKDSTLRTFTVIGLLCFVCSVLVCLTVVVLKPLQEKEINVDRMKSVLEAAGIDYEGEDITTLFNDKVKARLLDLDRNVLLSDAEVEKVVGSSDAGAYNFVRKEVNEGHQAYVICPLVEESESIEAKAATEEFTYLSNVVFKEFRLGLLHGKMSNKDKDAVMRVFKDHELDILVSTSVVEVGIDVPNSTVMLVESADRFGLSQLHQFRGRVGRGKAQSYCILVADNTSDVARQRLDILERNHNGFALADEDLKLRGPGEFFGTRQSGLPDLKMAKLSDASILEQARDAANMIIKEDPDLTTEKYALLSAEAKRAWDKRTEES